MIAIALLVPVLLMLLMFALGVLEDFLFPPPEPPPEAAIPEQPTSSVEK